MKNYFTKNPLVIFFCIVITLLLFINWSGDVNGKTDPSDIQINSKENVAAHFMLNAYNLTVTATTGGTIIVPSSSPIIVDSGVATTITASANTGYHFVNWTIAVGNASIADVNAISTTATLTSDDATVQANFTINTYTLTPSVVGNGSITPSTPQSVDYGTDKQFTFSPDVRHHFDSLLVDDIHVDSTTSYTFKNVMTGPHTIAAYFSINTYTLTYTAVANGSISGTSPQTVNHGSNGTAVSAVSDPGYHFVNWSDLSTANPRTDVNVTANISVTANFAINTYTLTYTASANGTISGTSPQTVNHGSNGTVVNAVPDLGYHFVNWSDLSTANPRTDVNVTADITVTANFALNTYNLTVTATTGGMITDPASSPVTVTHGLATTITAVATAGYTFIGWTVVSGSGVSIAAPSALSTTATLTNGNATIQANFVLNTYNLTVTATTGGSITVPAVSPVIVGHGIATTITAVATVEYTFTGWTVVSGTGVSIANPSALSTTATLTNGNATIQANFVLNTYNLTVTSTAGGSITVPASSPVTVSHGVATTITATASVGYTFTGWTVVSGSGVSIAAPSALSTTATLTNGNATIQANFVLNTYNLTVTATTGGTITVPALSPVAVTHGVATTITAVATVGYTFTGWTVVSGTGGSIANPSALSTTATLTNGNATIQANFVLNTYNLTVTSTTGGSITVPASSPVTVSHGVATTIAATASVGYTFIGWTVVNGTGVSIAAPSALSTTATLTNGNATIQANFVLKGYNLTVTATTGGTIIVPASSPVTVSHGVATTITAVATVGYTFTGWTVVSGTGVSITNPSALSTTVTLTSGDATVRANFTLNTYNLTVTATTGGTITVPASSPVTVSHGVATTITATASVGYTFTGWTVVSGSGVSIATPSALSTTVTLTSGNATVRANFVLSTYNLTVSATTGGTITVPAVSPITVTHGIATTITATASVGYTFTGWTVVSGSGVSIATPSALSTTVTLTSGNATVRANFKINTYQLTVMAMSGGTITVPATSPVTVNHGVATVITAKASVGYTFTGWTVVSGSGVSIATPSALSTTVTLVNGDAAVRANFIINTYTLTIDIRGNGSVIKNPDQPIYTHGTQVGLKAEPAGSNLIFSVWSGDVIGTDDSVTVIMDGNKTISATFIDSASYHVMYRSFRPESLALDKDNFGVLNKYVLRKPDKIDCVFKVFVDSMNITDLHVEFLNPVITGLPFYTEPPSTITKTAGDVTGKMWDFVFATPLKSYDSVLVHVFAKIGYDMNVNRYYWTRNNVKIGNNKLNATVAKKLYCYPMPNRVNALYETFYPKLWYGADGMVVGKNKKVGIDSSRYYGWFQTSRYVDVLKTLIALPTMQMHTQPAHGFNVINNGYILKGSNSSLPPTKYNNILLADMIALKLNIVASAVRFTPIGFGELMYYDQTEPSNPLNTKLVREIAQIGDELMMGQYDQSTGIRIFESVGVFANLARTIEKINKAFEGRIDTSSFVDSLRYKGMRPVVDVAYLRPSSAIPVVLIPFDNTISQEPLVYTLSQNYPNPFNPTTTIQFNLPEDAIVTLKIYNMLGQEVQTLLDRENMIEGIQEVKFNGQNLSSGVYFYRIITKSVDENGAELNSFQTAKKMMLLK